MGVTGSAWVVRLGLHLGRAPRQLAAILLPLLLLATPALARQQSSILIDYDSGEVLYADEPDAQAYPASLTKMMTLYLVFEALDQGRLTLDTKLKVSARAAAMPPTKLGLKAGSSIRVEDAIMALVTRSANDIASTIGENLGGSEARFAELMTTQARRLGMSRTTFRNASGLPHEDQRTTARDLSILAMSLIKNHPQHYRYFSRQRFVYGKRTLGNHNRMLASYTGMDGIKTGYTNASGFNLAASAVRKGRRLVAVVMGGNSAPARDVRMAKLLDRGFVQLAKERPTPKKAPAPLLVAGLPEVQEAAFVPGVTPPVPAARPEPAVEPAPASEPGSPAGRARRRGGAGRGSRGHAGGSQPRSGPGGRGGRQEQAGDTGHGGSSRSSAQAEAAGPRPHGGSAQGPCPHPLAPRPGRPSGCRSASSAARSMHAAPPSWRCSGHRGSFAAPSSA